MKIIEAKTAEEMYHLACTMILADGVSNSPRGLETRDLGTTAMVIEEPTSRIITSKARRINPYFMFAEFLWIITRNNKTEMISFYNRNMRNFSDDGVTLYGAYGPRIMPQIGHVIEKILTDPFTRQAIATILRSEDTSIQTKDFPCNITLHFLPQNGKLNLNIYVRSQDILLGFPYDIYHWSMLQEMVARAVKMDVGILTNIVGSLHVYDKDFDKVAAIANEPISQFSQFEYHDSEAWMPYNIQAISTIERKIRGGISEVNEFFKLMAVINEMNECPAIQEMLTTLAYWRIRNSPKFDEIKSSILNYTGYAPLIEHLNWQ